MTHTLLRSRIYTAYVQKEEGQLHFQIERWNETNMSIVSKSTKLFVLSIHIELSRLNQSTPKTS